MCSVIGSHDDKANGYPCRFLPMQTYLRKIIVSVCIFGIYKD